MANKKINELSTRTPSLTDLILVGDPTSGYSYKCTVTALATIIETDIADAYVTLDTAQTISGAKTFSNNLTLTSVTNAATTQTKFLTLNGSNIVNYRTGSQVLADIGGQGALTLTTTGTSGAATLVGNTLNIPQYADQYTGTVTSVGLTTGTTGTDISVSGSPITSSGTITLNIPTASATNRGALSSADWSTFNGKQDAITLTTTGSSGSATFVSNTLNIPTYTLAGLGGISLTSLSASAPLSYNSGTGAFSISQSSSSTNGYLSSTDWTTFNNKQNAITLTTTGSSGAATLVGATLNIPNYTLSGLGGISGSGTTNYIPKFTSSSAIGNSLMQEIGSTIFVGGNANITNANELQWKDSGGNSQNVLYMFSDNNVYLSSPVASSNLIFRGVGYAERMRLDASGNLIVGGTSALLSASGRCNITLNGTTDAILTFGNAGAYSGYIYSASNSLEIDAQGARYMQFNTNGLQRMRLDASGNLGLGVSPSAWSSPFIVLESGSGSTQSFVAFQSNVSALKLGTNQYYSAPNYLYKYNGSATRFDINSTNFVWNIAPSGTAGNVATFTEAMTLFSTGNLAVGGTSDNGSRLNVTGDGYFSGTVTAANGLISNRTADALSGQFLRSTINGTTIVNNGIILGKATSNNNAASIVYTHSSDGSTSNRLGFGFWGADNLLNLTAAGNVGIGTTSPGTKLEVYGSGLISSKVTSTDNQANLYLQGTFGQLENLAGDFYITNNAASSPLIFRTATTERMRITSGGDVGIGTTSPNTAAANKGLSIDGTSTILETNVSAARAGYLYSDASFSILGEFRNLPLLFRTNDTERMRISSTGSVRFNAYGSGSITGTPTYTLAVDASGNIIETTGSGISGSGTTNYLPKFSASTTLANSRLFDDGTTTFLGNGDVNATPSTGIFSGTGGTGTNIAGAELRLRGGASTGSGAGGVITFYTSAAGTAGSTVNAATERMRILSNGNVIINNTTGSYPLTVNGGIASTNNVTATTGSLGVLLGTAGTAIGSCDLGFIVSDNNGYGTFNDLIISPRNNGANQGAFRVYTSGSERFKINSNGTISFTTSNITVTGGSGTVTPLTLSGGSANFQFRFTSGNTDASIYNSSAGGIKIETLSGSNGIYLNGSGNTGLGTTTVGSKLQVNGGAAIGYSSSTAAPTNGLAVAGGVTIGTATNNVSSIVASGYSLTGANAQSLIDLAGTWNTTGNPTAIKLNITNTASGTTSYLMDLQVGGVTQFRVTKTGTIRTTAPTGGTANDWKLGTRVASSMAFDATQYLEVEVGGTLYRVALATLA